MASRGRFALHALLAFLSVGATTGLAAAAIGPSALVAGVPRGEGLHDFGRADGALRVRLALLLNYRNDAELDRLLDEQRDAASPLYGQFLTSQQFRAYFAPTPETYARVAAALGRAGFTITHAFANRTVIDASAPAPVVERYFHTEIHRLAVDGVGVHYANARPAYMPADLRGLVGAVLGFDDLQWFRPLYQFVPRQQLQTVALPSSVIGPPLKGPDGSYGPLAFAGGYDLPVQHKIPHQKKGTTYDGTGRTAGIEIPADPSDSDLAKFLTYFKIARTGTTTRVPVDGGPQNPSGGSLLEAALDYQTIAGVAPGAKIYIYEFPGFTNQDVLDGYNAAVSDNVADTINSSFGACEIANIWSPTSIANIFKQGSAQGQVFHASSGDSGTYTYGCSSAVSVLTPTDTPYTVSIGGTTLSIDSNAKYQGETYWNNGFGAGGGGVSKVFKLPKWQKKAQIKQSGRAVPDISFDADPVTGEDIVYGGSWIGGGVGGTSLASPIFGGCLVEVEQMLGHRVSKPDKTLYKNWLALGYGSGSTPYAHDVTTGASFGILVPGPGYDLATGIGSLDCFVGGAAYF
jgi:xanthomonalisin